MVVDVFQHGQVAYEFILDLNLLLRVIHNSVNKHQCPVVSGNLVNNVRRIFVELAKNMFDLDLVSLESLNMAWVVIVDHIFLSALSEHIVHIEGWLVAYLAHGAFTKN